MSLRNTLSYIKNKFQRDSTCMKSYPHQGIISSVSLQKLSSAFQAQKIHVVKRSFAILYSESHESCGTDTG